MFLAPRLRYATHCDWASYTVMVEKPIGTDPPFSIWPYKKPDCWDQRTGANATHNWVTVPYKGDCDVILDVQTFLCIGNLLSLS